MKKTVLLILLCVFLFSSGIYVGAAARDNLYRKFGPMLLEAVVMVIKDEINLLRTEHGLPERTNTQLVNAIETKLSEIKKYEWMEN